MRVGALLLPIVLAGTEATTLTNPHAYLYLGGPSGLGITPAATFQPTVGYWSASVGGAGDVNGDGFSDVLVGISQRSTVGVYLGGATGPSTTPASLLTAADDRFGYSVARAGDINGDSLSDIVIGTTTTTVSGIGRAYFYGGSVSGVTSAPIRSYVAPDGYNFGHAVGGSTGP